MRYGGPILVIVSLATLGVVGGEQPRFHTDPTGLEQATFDAQRALLWDDVAEARRQLDVVERLCRRLGPSDDDAWGSDTRSFDRGFHAALDRARELAGAGDADGAFENVLWVVKGCRKCHQVTREE